MSRFRATKMSIINYYTYLAIKLMQQFIGPNWYEQEQEQHCSGAATKFHKTALDRKRRQTHLVYVQVNQELYCNAPNVG